MAKIMIAGDGGGGPTPGRHARADSRTARMAGAGVKLAAGYRGVGA